MDYCDCNCGCHENASYTPLKNYNPAGQSSLSYRVGTHAIFKKDLLSKISSQYALSKLTTRNAQDLSIGLMDSWAMVADVLTFYQERIANEGFLRTATERRSILELARSIGYELRPGVAASTYLAFSMDTSTASPKKATIAVETKVQSVPAQNQKPQVFETVEQIEARQDWSEIRPQQLVEQNLYDALEAGKVVFNGTAAKLRPGDGLLFVMNGKAEAFRMTGEVKVDAENQQTVITFTSLALHKPAVSLVQKNMKDPTIIEAETLFTVGNFNEIISSEWTESELEAKVELEGWSMDVVVDAVNSKAREDDKGSEDSVYALRVKCGVFGNNAPLWASLPPQQRYKYRFWVNDHPHPQTITPPFPEPGWDPNVISVNKDSSGTPYDQDLNRTIYLDNIYQGIQPGTWIILTDYSNTSAYKITSTKEATLNDFALNAKVTGVTMDGDNWKNLSDSDTTSVSDDLGTFGFRSTTVYAMPEKLDLAKVRIDAGPEGPVKGKEIVLEKMIGWLHESRPILISGELEDQAGITKKELVFLSSIVHFEVGLLTKLYISYPYLRYKYKRNTVKINANLALATHGETNEEAIGSGDPTQTFQQVILKKNPLTYVSGSTPTGITSTLKIRVDGVEWEEKDSFEKMGYSDNGYVVRHTDDSKTIVRFGDGKSGRLPQSGKENIRAKYRVGLGLGGRLEADQLSILMTRPLGVRSVTNPLETKGGADSEVLEDAQKNAPRTVLTLDRIVSLEDFKSFAQGFAGIGKATSYSVKLDMSDIVLVTVATTDGEEVGTDLHDKLVNAIDKYKDPTAQFAVRSFNKRTFNVSTRILVYGDRLFDDVKRHVQDALEKEFSFEKRDFGQAVTISEVISVVQNVDGVEAVDIDSFYEYPITSLESLIKKEERIRARGLEDTDGVTIPSLLLINSKDGITIGEMQR